MKIRKLAAAGIAAGAALALGATSPSRAEDIDLFVGGSTVSDASRPNVLIVIDNSANWSAASQHWPGGIKQGQSELTALRTVVGELNQNFNLGLMLFTPGSGTNKDGGYVRFAVRQTSATNKAALQELIGTASCADGANSLNGTPNCIYKNFDAPVEKVGTAKTDYSATLFEVFKYFGGYTNPANARTDVAGSPVDASHYGPLRYAGDPDAKSDGAAFNPSSQRATYLPPVSATNSCAKNYVIFIGNGFPTQDSPASLLTGVGGDATQLSMAQYSTTSTTTTTTIGTACGNNASACTSNIPQSLKDANPADSYACTGSGVTDTAVCSTGKKFTVTATTTAYTVTPTGTSATPGTSEARYADEWTKYLYTTDVSAAPGQQNIATYTIDVFKDAQDARQTRLLQSMAKYGGGRYFQATNESAIINALREILVEIQAVNSVFAAASLPINATNRSQNENQVFVGMFRPDADGRPRWYGNLKRYQIGLFADDAKLADKNGQEAVSASTGFVQSCATSFWTTDSGSYWSFAPTSAGLCTTSGTNVFSDQPDGPLVEKGAAAEVLRLGNDPGVAATYAVNRSLYTCSGSCSNLLTFNTTNVSVASVGAASTADRDSIVAFTRGQDVNDENGNGNLTETRPSLHGDVAHSRPLPVNYGGSRGVVVYYGSNDGTFHATSGENGKELWGFIAPEHFGRLKRLRDNSPIIRYPGTPTTITPTPASKDYFFDGSAGLYQTADNSRVWIYPTMRRGGRMLYAFDVTNPASPSILWKAGCPAVDSNSGCTSGFDGIGQTWSLPNVAKVQGYENGSKPLIVVGGGYDACEDQDTASPSCSGTGVTGRKVYVIDAEQGQLIRTFDADRSVPADTTLIDRNFDGYVDHAYVADTGGNLYRIDFSDPSTLAAIAPERWVMTKIAQTNVSTAGRKFLFAPAALPSRGKVYVTIGTGDRERPLISNYPYVSNVVNRFYMFVDNFSAGGPVDLDGASMSDYSSGSTCTTRLSSSSRGWYINLEGGRGEQTVTSSVIFGGIIAFSTNRPVAPAPGTCSADLGEARGYALNLLNASGAVGTDALCGGSRSGLFTGGGLPPSPVTGTARVNGRPVSIMIGGVNRSGAASSPIGSQHVKPYITQRRTRTYWYKHGDK